MLTEILDGAREVADEAGIAMLGGHTVEDTEPKFGWVVTGVVAEEELWRNKGAQPGDLLLLTKPVGTGVWATAAKHGVADAGGWGVACRVMRELNRLPAEILRTVGPHAVTDVTGFGLLGHLLEMARASGVTVEIEASRVPLMGGVRDLAAMGLFPAGSHATRRFCERALTVHPEVDPLLVDLLADAQTSGGLLISVASERAETLHAALGRRGIPHHEIGRVLEKGEGAIRVVR